jgi:hypothetical protein
LTPGDERVCTPYEDCYTTPPPAPRCPPADPGYVDADAGLVRRRYANGGAAVLVEYEVIGGAHIWTFGCPYWDESTVATDFMF